MNIILDHLPGDVIKVDGICYIFNGIVNQEITHANADVIYNTCESCQGIDDSNSSSSSSDSSESE